ncbi:copper amine oxidase N-terminal domain-containing protein [Cohnella silvisoli]|uniref:Stalk domain-containing protein n=1 Tax=Cohnella silvisoli TaxID=2873699 RepID=A0ABV1KSA3_9BACL|nr:copper amine oxidase N-terminal domain-containing protein [Cohnella silvisoli]MCD9021651.1 ankyrin repeat domain-containing protein [Cohnella silvisoli]
MRKLLCFILFFLVAGSTLLPAKTNAQSGIQVNLNGTVMGFVNKPILKNNTVMVPFRELFDSMGIIVNYDAKTKTIRGRQDEGSITEVALTIGETIAFINENPIALHAGPEVLNNVTYIPLRFVGEATGAIVTWSSITQTVTIKERPDILLERLCKQGNLDGVMKVLNENRGMDLNHNSGTYLLHAILYGKKIGVMQALVNAGADVNVRTYIDATPLMLASNYTTEWVQWLLDHGADPRMTDKDGRNVLEQMAIINDERKKIAEILSRALNVESITLGYGVVEMRQLPYDVNLPKQNFLVTIESLSENELGYIVRVKIMNNSLEKSLNSIKVELISNESTLKRVNYSRISGNETFGKGSAIYEYVFEKTIETPNNLVIALQDGYGGHYELVGVKSSSLSQSSMSFQQLQPYLIKKYSKVMTDSGVAEFKISVYSWNYRAYRIEVQYDTTFFWHKDIMTAAVQEQLRTHMRTIAADVIQRFPNMEFVGTYHYSWYKYPNIRVDLQTSDHMTWDTNGAGQEPGMPARFQWTPSKDDTLILF